MWRGKQVKKKPGFQLAMTWIRTKPRRLLAGAARLDPEYAPLAPSIHLPLPVS